jgi:hypothetical protein
MSLWISTTREGDHRLPPPPAGSALPPQEEGRSWGTYVLVGLIGLSAGLAFGQIVAEHRTLDSRIAWPAPALPHPRTLPP